MLIRPRKSSPPEFNQQHIQAIADSRVVLPGDIEVLDGVSFNMQTIKSVTGSELVTVGGAEVNCSTTIVLSTNSQ